MKNLNIKETYLNPESTVELELAQGNSNIVILGVGDRDRGVDMRLDKQDVDKLINWLLEWKSLIDKD